MTQLTDHDQAAIIFDHFLSFVARADLMPGTLPRLLLLMKGADGDSDPATNAFIGDAVKFLERKRDEEDRVSPSAEQLEEEWAAARSYANKNHHGCLGAYCEECDGNP